MALLLFREAAPPPSLPPSVVAPRPPAPSVAAPEQAAFDAPAQPPAVTDEAPAPTGSLTVRVREASGAPAAAARVSCRQGRQQVVEPTDPSGVAVLELGAGAWQVAVASERGATSLRAVEVTAGGKHVLDLVLGPSARLEGAVVDEAGRPRGQVRLGLHDVATELLLDRPLTNPDGTFAFELGSAQVEVRLADPRYAMWRRKVTLPQTGLQVVAVEPRILSVRVVDEAGAPADDAFVELQAQEFQAVARSSSALRRLLLRPGTVRLRAVRTSRGPLERATQTVQLAGPEPVEVTLQLRRAPGLTGVVIDPHGVPLANVLVVALAQARALTDDERASRRPRLTPADAVGQSGADGRFELSPAHAEDPGASYRLQALGLGLREPLAPLLVQLGDEPVRIQLQRD